MEIEKNKVTARVKEEPSLMVALTADTLRALVNASNNEKIKKENIVSLLKENGQFVLIYYK